MAKIKTFASGAPLTASDVNDYLNPEVPAGSTAVNHYAPATAPAAGFDASGVAAYRSGLVVVVDGNAVVSAGGKTLPQGPTLTPVCTLPHRPRKQQIQRVTSQLGDLEAVLSPTGLLSVRSLQTSMAFGAGNYISFDGLTYIAALS